MPAQYGACHSSGEIRITAAIAIRSAASPSGDSGSKPRDLHDRTIGVHRTPPAYVTFSIAVRVTVRPEIQYA